MLKGKEKGDKIMNPSDILIEYNRLCKKSITHGLKYDETQLYNNSQKQILVALINDEEIK